ncbi:MAG TPA: hypothetical protein DEB09_05000 [Candidatus Magasanikbacteria bacterium]|nr:hypothetical protein [Candidatus Magasanikbacteria bacterium]
MWTINKTQKKDAYQSKEYGQFIQLRIVSLIFIGLLLIGSTVSILFIYKNIFDTITQAEAIIMAKNSPMVEIIDFSRYETTKKAWEEKNNRETINLTKDPFNVIQVVVEKIKPK